MKPISIMGILNVTPDSFSDGGLFYNNVGVAVGKAAQMLQDGADIIDLGGESSRPGAELITVQEELQRVIPVVDALRSELGNNFTISVDTYKAEVAEEALQHGVTMINSMGGFSFDSRLAAVVEKHGCKVGMYHIKGTPQTMQTGEIIYDDVIKDISSFFEKQMLTGDVQGVDRKKYILDPGIGFGKTVQHNLEILRRLAEFKSFELPILIGVSRKGHIGTILKDKLRLADVPSPLERLEGALADTAVAVINGASIVRTHDVLETKKFLAVLEELV
jgi:dihydropteroate synthase